MLHSQQVLFKLVIFCPAVGVVRVRCCFSLLEKKPQRNLTGKTPGQNVFNSMCRWDSVDLCPNSMLNYPFLKPPHEYAGALSLKLPQFCCWGDTALGKYSPSLLRVTINLSLSHTHTHRVCEIYPFRIYCLALSWKSESNYSQLWGCPIWILGIF